MSFKRVFVLEKPFKTSQKMKQVEINIKADGKEQKMPVNLDKKVIALKKMIEDT